MSEFISIKISNIVNTMREYQKNNNIKKQCVTNTQYLYDTIRMNCSNNVKAKAVLVFSSTESIIVRGHLVIILDDEIILDPSHDVFCLKNKTYFDTINDFMNSFHNDDLKRMNKKEIIKCHVDFMKIAEKINSNKIMVANKNFYMDQADYIERIFS